MTKCDNMSHREQQQQLRQPMQPNQKQVRRLMRPNQDK